MLFILICAGYVCCLIVDRSFGEPIRTIVHTQNGTDGDNRKWASLTPTNCVYEFKLDTGSHNNNIQA